MIDIAENGSFKVAPSEQIACGAASLIKYGSLRKGVEKARLKTHGDEAAEEPSQGVLDLQPFLDAAGERELFVPLLGC